MGDEPKRERWVNSEEYQKFVDRLRAAREHAGPSGKALTQEELGRRMKKSQVWVSKSESKDRRMSVPDLIVWIKACGLNDANAILGFTGETPPATPESGPGGGEPRPGEHRPDYRGPGPDRSDTTED